MNNKVYMACVGNADSGKSSLIGTLATNILDDGRGSARRYVLSHPHEVETGMTSAVNTVHVPCPEDPGNEIVLLDLAGQEKYLKTTFRGLTEYSPKLAILVINCLAGFSGTTKEHLKICRNLSLPFIIVVTKIDMAQPEMIGCVHAELKQKLKLLHIQHSYVIFGPTDQDANIIHSQIQPTNYRSNPPLGPSATDAYPPLGHSAPDSNYRSNPPLGPSAPDSNYHSNPPLKSSGSGIKNAQEAGEEAPKISGDGFLSIRDVFEIYNSNPQMICPIFNVSNKTGSGLDQLKEFLNCVRLEIVNSGSLRKTASLSSRGTLCAENPLKDFLEENAFKNFFKILKYYHVEGVGHIFFGENRFRSLFRGQRILAGPFYSTDVGGVYKAYYKEIRIKNLRLDSTRYANLVEHTQHPSGSDFDVQELKEGMYGCINFSFTDGKFKPHRKHLSLCSVIISKEFSIIDIKIEASIVSGGAPVKKGYRPYVESDTMRSDCSVIYTEKCLTQDAIRQQEELKASGVENLKPIVNGYQEGPLLLGDRGNIYVRFKMPKIFYPGQRILFRDRGLRIAGIVREVSSSRLDFANPNFKAPIEADVVQNPVISPDLEKYLSSLSVDINKLIECSRVDYGSGSGSGSGAAAACSFVSAPDPFD